MYLLNVTPIFRHTKKYLINMLEKKLKSFVHYKDYESSGLNLSDLKRLINEKKVMYNHKIDKKKDRWKGGGKLETLDLQEMPSHIIENYQKYKLWLDKV